VDDIVEALIRMMATAPQTVGPINIGNPNEFTIRALAELVLDLTNSKSKITYKPAPDDDPRQRKPDISRAKRELDWEPTVALRDGLIRTIEFFERFLRGDGRRK
jgi:UDP-glucuronate decarboxylase